MPDPGLSVVVACYNEQEVLGELHRRLTEVCRTAGLAYEIVLIDDGSRDATWQQMKRLAETDEHVVGLRLSRNHGHQLALTAGLTFCRGERILIIDADLQDPPELLPKMIEQMDAGADIVYGQRTKREGETIMKRFTAFVFYRFIRAMTETHIPMDTGDFRLMSRRALDALLSMPERHRFIRGMVSWIGFAQVPIQYERKARHAGETKYPFRKMFRFAWDAVTAFSIKPLTIAMWIGLSGALFSMGVLLWTFIGWLAGKTITGWASMLGVVSLLGSIQLIVLGVMGQYLGRLYEQSKGRPLFIVQDVVRSMPATEKGAAKATVVAPGT